MIGFGMWLAALAGLLMIEPARGVLEVHLTTDTFHPRPVRLYYDLGNGLNEADSSTAWVRPEARMLHFPLPAGEIRMLRMDPLLGDTPLRIQGMRVTTSRLAAPRAIPLHHLRAEEHIASLESTPAGMQVVLAEGFSHPQLILEPDRPVVVSEAPPRLVTAGVSAALLVVVLLTVWRMALSRIWSWQLAVALGLGMVFILAWTMAWSSPSTGRVLHPEENTNIWCYQFYLDHLWPRPVDDPALVRTLSLYGFSYLFELDVVYALAARTTGAFSAWFANDMMAARSFNLILLLGLTGLAFRHPRWALPLSVMLINPQTWYLFSHFNADALPFALAMVTACAAADRDSSLNRYLDGRSRFGAGTLLFAIAVGLLLVSKRTFLPIVPVLGLWLAVHHVDMRTREVVAMLAGLLLLGASMHLQSLPGWPGTAKSTLTVLAGITLAVAGAACTVYQVWRRPGYRARLLRLVTVFGLAILIVSPWIGLDLALNGTPGQKAETLKLIAETHADDGFKPSQLTGDQAYPGRAMAQRGISLTDVLLEPYHWLGMSWATAFGVYSYLSVYPPAWLLQALQGLTLAITALAIVSLVRTREGGALPSLAIFAGGVALVLASSWLHSWVTDFQPQGRYLLSIIPMLALMIGTGRKTVPLRLYGVLIAAAFILSCLSFVGTALPALANTL